MGDVARKGKVEGRTEEVGEKVRRKIKKEASVERKTKTPVFFIGWRCKEGQIAK